MSMNEVAFKAQYVTQFLAAYMAQTYERDCQNGHQGKPYDNQPVEDAHFLAKCAWEQIVKHQHHTDTRSTLFVTPTSIDV